MQRAKPKNTKPKLNANANVKVIIICPVTVKPKGVKPNKFDPKIAKKVVINRGKKA